jgi:hypothetical protein
MHLNSQHATTIKPLSLLTFISVCVYNFISIQLFMQNSLHTFSFGRPSRRSPVSIVTRLRPGQPERPGLILAREEFTLHPRPDQLWYLPSPLSNSMGEGNLFTRCKEAGA